MTNGHQNEEAFPIPKLFHNADACVSPTAPSGARVPPGVNSLPSLNVQSARHGGTEMTSGSSRVSRLAAMYKGMIFIDSRR